MLTSDWFYKPLPSKNELSVYIEPIYLGLLDSYKLRQCGLFELIAENNSILGKVADPFRQFDYQTALLLGLRRCLDNDQLPEKLKQTLQDIYSAKQRQLPLYQWKVIYHSDAMRKQLSGQKWITVNHETSVRQINRALASLKVTFNGNNEQSNTVRWQEVLEKQPTLGELNYSLSYATHYIELATAQLKRYDTQIVCGPQRDTTKFRYLNNVFNQHYIDKILPYLSTLDSYAQQLTPSFELFTMNNSVSNYVFPIQHNHTQFNLAIKSHVEYWQGLFKRCGKKIGN